MNLKKKKIRVFEPSGKSVDHHGSHSDSRHQSFLFSPFNYYTFFWSSWRATQSKCNWTIQSFARTNCFKSGWEILIDYRQRFLLLCGPMIFYFFPLKAPCVTDCPLRAITCVKCCDLKLVFHISDCPFGTFLLKRFSWKKKWD